MVGVGRDGMTAGCLNINRGKRGMPLDIDSPAGLEAVHKLVATADVFVQNLRPPAATHLGMGVDAVRVIRPDIVYFIAGAMSDAQWRGMCTVLGRPARKDDPRFDDTAGHRRANDTGKKNPAVRGFQFLLT